MFEDFDSRLVDVDRGTIFARVGGEGPPLLLLHGYPQTHVIWHDVVPQLTSHHTVVVVDLPGYGRSFRPETTDDHSPYSKRAMANDLVQLMAVLGFEQFAVAGHDRGGRIAYRMALDHGATITAVGVFDVVPTGEVWARANAQLALTYWHWAFLAQPEPLPEELINSNPGAFFDHHILALGLGRTAKRYPVELMTLYREILDDPTVVHGICEDYRAGAGIDRVHDDEDVSSGNLITCPLLALWSAPGALPKFYGDVLAIWRRWATDVRGTGLAATHFLVEDQPDQVANELLLLLDPAAQSR
ncbi:alpha/beta fold hydrolase [Lacisediminihabitans changchengi]|uniref:Alpha/beta hydrolase n=1 Tax=Lacisediminihabitans changchengi TaxID=2787634 RepID=A0A934W2Y9_9MICO|nr:alpha/beta hydrolase [Lacisediminihabitans changchengi]MBK4346669.1 alpha/beta hydrolase [Lacisediminihabitans changchengi]